MNKKKFERKKKVKLNKNALLWVRALRSGKYKQGRQVLNSPKGFCCLGVACDLYQKHRRKLHKKLLEERVAMDSQVEGAISYDGEWNILPEKVRVWLGLSDTQGPLRLEGVGPTKLWKLNDSGHWDFKKLADLIQSNPTGLFVSKK